MPTPRERIEALYASFARGDVPGVLGALHPAIEWTEAAGFPYGGTYVGPQAVLDGVFMKLATEWEGFAAVPSEILVDGDTVVALGEYSGTWRGTGKSFRAPMVHVWRFRDGAIVAFQQHTDTVLVQAAMR